MIGVCVDALNEFVDLDSRTTRIHYHNYEFDAETSILEIERTDYTLL